ncbi:zliS Lysozyme family protein [uncultured Caudovirales phage]|uniref:ZliS Lysozyme family protein n=1 Tax=uncultured Caudovirales phage TaxID=2100421 RepID=A0A6J5REG3_9CAUD|nr:zliS Lysozyme family protein [uncultured Caudovirales phage]CAB4189994.1 zliS Lysozyme family protein [uncultured Caudovirales phage]
MTDAFDKAVTFTLRYEGGYSNDPRDPGGETKYGISKRAYPGEDIPNLTVDRAQAIYRRDYWDRNRCGALPPHMGACVFDAAVNGGRPIYWLQAAVGAGVDGALGPRTIAAANAFPDKPGAVAAMLADRIIYLSALGGWVHYNRGWTRRVIALSMLRME